MKAIEDGDYVYFFFCEESQNVEVTDEPVMISRISRVCKVRVYN